MNDLLTTTQEQDTEDGLPLADLNPDAIATELQRIEEAWGDNAQSVRIFRTDFSRVMREGVVVSLHIGRYRGQKSLELSDLGLSSDHEGGDAKKMISLGSKLLLPPELIQEAAALENRARRALDKRAFKLHWGYFVLANDYVPLREELQAIRAEYMGVCEKIVEQYEDIQEEVTREYRRMAAIAYGRYAKLDPRPICRPGVREQDNVDIWDERNWLDVGEYADIVVENILSQFPTPEAIQGSYHFEWDIMFVPLHRLLAEEEAAADIIRQRAQTERSVQEAARREVEWQEEVARRLAVEEIRRAEAETRVVEDAARTKERMLAEMYADEMVSRKRQLEKETQQYVESISNMQAQFVAVIYEAAIAAMSAIKKNNRLTGKNIHQLKDMIERVKSWNKFLDCPEAITMIENVETALQTKISEGAYNLGLLEGKLRATAIVTQEMLRDLGNAPRLPTDRDDDKWDMMSQIALATPTTVRQSREMLGLSVLENLDIPDAPPMRRTREL